jgi:WD40 repeat protein
MLPAHVVLVALLAAPPTVFPKSKEPAVYATIKLGKDTHGGPVEFSPDGKTLAYVSDQYVKAGGGIEMDTVVEKMVLWDVVKKEEVNTVTQGKPRNFRSLAWEPDGKGFIADYFSRVGRVDARTGKSEALYDHCGPERDYGEVYVVRYLPERKLIVSGGSDGLVRFWDTEKGKELKAVRCAPDKDNYPLAVAVVPNANKVIVAAELATVTKEIGGGGVVHSESSMFAIDMKDYSVSTILKDAPSLRRKGLVELPAGGEFAYGTEDGVVFTDAETLKTRTSVRCPVDPSELVFTPNGRYLIVAGPLPIPPLLSLIAKPVGIAVYDMAAEKWIAYWQVKGERPGWSVSYSESNNLLAHAGEDNTITVWDMKGIIDPDAKPKKK